MRLVLPAILALCLSLPLAVPASAACEIVRDPDWGRETAEQARQALCFQRELAERLAAEQRLAQIRAEADLRLKLLELEQRFARNSTVNLPPPLPPLPSF